MSEVTRILSQIESGDPSVAEQLLPLVYDELRKLAAARLAQESPGQTLQATALVHEAYLRLVKSPVRASTSQVSASQASPERTSGKFESPVETAPRWDSRGHFFAAAAEAMRRILVDRARRQGSAKRGGGRERVAFDEATLVSTGPSEDVLALDEALSRFEGVDPRAAELVKLRYFAGLTIPEAAQSLGVSPRTADDIWAYARAWLFRALRPESD